MSKNYSTIAKLDEHDFMEVKSKHPGLIKKLNDLIAQYRDVWKIFLFRALYNVDMFSHGLSLKVMEEMVWKL